MFYPPVHLFVLSVMVSPVLLFSGAVFLVVSLKAIFMPSYTPRMSPLSDDL